MEDQPKEGSTDTPTCRYGNIALVHNVQFVKNRVCRSPLSQPDSLVVAVTSKWTGSGGAYEVTVSRDDMIRENLKNCLIYISHCIKPTDILNIPLLFTKEEKSQTRAEKDEIRQTRLALEVLIGKQNEKGRFVQLRDALFKSGEYPKIVEILDGNITPKDQNYIKVLELFTPQIIRCLKPTELLPFLQNHEVFQHSDIQEITAEEKNHGTIRASSLLLIYLPCRITNWFDIFLRALIECDLSDLAEMLDPDLYKDIVTGNTGGSKAEPMIPIRNERKQKPAVTQKQLADSESVLRLSIYEYDTEKIETLTNSPTDRLNIDKCMAEDDAKIVWPNVKHGENYVMIRCTSQDDCEECSEKVTKWKNVAKRRFEELLNKFVSSHSGCVTSNASGSSLSKIIASGENKKPVRAKCNLKRYFNSFAISEREGTKSNCTSFELCYQNKNITQQQLKTFSSCEMAGGRTISVVLGPLEELRVDVMVSPSDRHLRLNSGLAETISMRGGASMQKTCLMYTQKYRSMDEADAIETEPGDLPAEHVIIVISPVWKEENHDQSKKLLKKAIMNALVKASALKATSVSLPAISCGISGFPTKIGTTLIVQAVENFFREEQESSLKNVYIVDTDDNTVKRFHQALLQEFKDDKSCTIHDYI